MSKKIANTKRSGLSVVRVDRNKLDTLYYQLIDIVQDGNLGDEYVNFFAKPKDVTVEKSIDWYTDLEGEVVSFNKLQDAEKSAFYQKYQEMCSKLKSYSEELRAKGDRSSADLIKSALIIPNESYLVKVGEHVVMTCWGFLDSTDITVRDGTIMGSYSDGPSHEDNGMGKGSMPKDAPTDESASLENENNTASSDEQEPPSVVPPEASEPPKKKSFLGLILFLMLLMLIIIALLLWFFLFKNKDNPDNLPPTPQPVAEQPLNKPHVERDLSSLKGDLTIEQGLENDNHELLDITISIDNNFGKGVVEIKSKTQKCTGTVLGSILPDERINYALSHIACPNGNDFEDFDFVCEKDRTSCRGTSKDGALLEVTPKVDN